MNRQASAMALPSVRISEFHYDNPSTDVDEKVEISGPAGTSLNGWSLVLYNGTTNSRQVYTTTSLNGMVIPATCGTRGVVVISYPSNGIQNGAGTSTGIDPDGMALVNNGAVVEFLSYEGSFTAANGPAAGMTSTDIGIRELGAAPEGTNPVWSLKRDGAGVWSGPSVNNFGVCNDADSPPPAEVDHVTVSPDNATIIVGAQQTFTAVAFDASNQPINGVVFTWTSSAPSVASVSAGVATGLAEGTALISAAAPNGVEAGATLQVNAPVIHNADLHITEIHYDPVGIDAGEAIEVDGPAGTNLSGYSLVLYNGNGNTSYSTTNLSGALTDQCSGRGVTVITYPSGGIQNGSPDGVALVGPGGLIEFLSYEGTMTAANGPAAGVTSIDIGVHEENSPSDESLQRNPSSGVWYGPYPSTFGTCNSSSPLPRIIVTGRTSADPALPVGFEDQLFASLKDAYGNTVPTTFTWASETPSLASIDADGVMHGLSAGTAVFRATAGDGTTTTRSFQIIVATASTTAQYGNNTEFGDPTDADASDDFIVRRAEYTLSYSSVRNTPNWVAYDLDASHIGTLDRCDCFTFDPELPSTFFHYNTNAFTGSAAINGFGIDRGHLARSFDRTTGTLDNAHTFYLSNIIPQASALNQGPWAVLETYLGDKARFDNKEVYIVAGVAGNRGTLKNEGHIVIPAQVWKVAVIMPRDKGLSDIQDYRDVEVVAAIMPNDPIVNSDWHTYVKTVDDVEALSGYDVLSALPDKIERIVEANIKPPLAFTDGPYTGIEASPIAMSGASSLDTNGTVASYQWDFGDGATGTGANVTHTYAIDGTYNVRLIVTDNDALADTVTTTATVAPMAAPRRIDYLRDLVKDLMANDKLSRGNGTSLIAKLNAAAAQLEHDTPAAQNQLQAFKNELDALVQGGVISASEVQLVDQLVQRIIAMLN